ncbi:uncharacterized protein LOC123676438 isoform X3 [Harmonia axyridis]|uniref:uncharacterized protein LOC123676438 isoform X3 n=1 Tax=Harmonia axyridis TaxID=115357 RepID=UPI001E274E9A|nr:uncharacterized protein LOC123676438 isoform X3 [Harmonia axyridis]
MSFESRKFFRSTRSRKIVELATSKISYKDESTVTNEYDFVEDTNDPWHNYKLWKNSKNVEKEIEVFTKKGNEKRHEAMSSSKSSLLNGTVGTEGTVEEGAEEMHRAMSCSQSSLFNMEIDTEGTAERGSEKILETMSFSNSSLFNAEMGNEGTVEEGAEEIHEAMSSSKSSSSSSSSFSEREREKSNEIKKKRRPIFVLQGDYSIEFSRRERRIWDKRDRCVYCNEDVTNFSRHLFRKHSEEECVKKILNFPKNHSSRKKLINSLRKDGNFSLYIENTIRPVQRPSTLTSGNLNYYPCKYCKGFYKKKSLGKHIKICEMRNENVSQRNRYSSEGLMMLAFEESKKTYLDKLRLKKEVFSTMHADRIALEGMRDPIACQYAEDYLKQHRRPHIKNLVSNKIRELGRLIIQLKDVFGLKSILDSLKPEHFDKMVSAARILAGYNESSKNFQAPSLALHFRTILVQVCSTAETMILKKNPLIKIDNINKTLKDIRNFKTLVESNWKFEMGSLALKDLTEKHSTNIQKLPLTKDLILFNKYCYQIADRAKNDLQSDINNLGAFKKLSETVLVLTISINRKRVGDVQYTKIETYTKNHGNNDCLDILSESEKQITKFFKRIVTIGKGSRAVPLLFPKKIQEYIEILLSVRKQSTLVPQENPYLFALAGSSSKWIDGPSTLRRYAKSCGAENPETITSSRLRKQIATVLQILNLSEVEMEQIAKFMGHTKKTHEQFYRLPQDLFQTSKVAKLLLMTMEKGISTEEQGKTIEEIDFELGTWGENEKNVDNEDASVLPPDDYFRHHKHFKFIILMRGNDISNETA